MPGALDGVQLHLVNNLDELDNCRRWVAERRETPLMADTESGGTSPHRHKWRLGQLGDLRHGWAFPARGWGGAFLELLTKYEGPIGFHNSPYDSQVLEVHAGWKPPWPKIEDSLLGGHLHDSLKLGALKPRASIEIDPRANMGEAVMKEGMARQHWSWATVPDTWGPYWMYGALDPVLAAHLWLKFLPAVQQHRVSYDLERTAARICEGMMMAGMMIDVPFINQSIGKINSYHEKAMNRLRMEFSLSSVNSNDQVGAMLSSLGIPILARTAEGKPKIDKETLEMYGAEYPEHSSLFYDIRFCRKAEKLTTLLNRFLELRGSDDVMHYSIWSSRARTSRMSITDPAMQTFDRDEPILRGAYIPRPGNCLITIDADQIEARLAAHFSGDQRMIHDFHEADRTGAKFFILMAGRIYNRSITKKDPEYTWTKNATYAQIYGSGLAKAAATAGVPVAQMTPVYEGFKQLYPGVMHLMNRLIREGKATARPRVQTLTGRWLYTYKGKEYALLNTKIQGSAAEIMKNGLIGLDAAGFGPYLRLPIHDEVLMEVPREIAADVLSEASRILTDRENFAVPITWAGSILEDRWKKT